MPHDRVDLPCPQLTLAVELPGLDDTSRPSDDVMFTILPARAGVLAIEDAAGATLTLVSTANLRRAATTRLGPPPADQPRSRRIDLRGVARRVCAVTVGSAFEADWAYLQLARRRLPHSYRSAVDRWQAWFVHCDPHQEFPQWIKTAHAGSPPTGENGTYVGPFADKHAAARFIDMLEDAFDLCRYHHILTQAPKASACAYKEMGKCPAPCDGSISLDAYREMIRSSIDFARAPANCRAALDREMRAAGGAMDYETAHRCKRSLERTAAAERHEFARVGDLEDFIYVALAPSVKRGWVRVFAIRGGWIAPVLEVSSDTGAAECDASAHCRQAFADSITPRQDMWFSRDALENIGMTCRHLLPRAADRRARAVFIHRSLLHDDRALTRMIASFAKSDGTPHADTVVDSIAVDETELQGM